MKSKNKTDLRAIGILLILHGMQYTYKIMLHQEPEGGYTVTVPALPGCISFGEDEAIEMAKDAIAIYSEELQSREAN